MEEEAGAKEMKEEEKAGERVRGGDKPMRRTRRKRAYAFFFFPPFFFRKRRPPDLPLTLSNPFCILFLLPRSVFSQFRQLYEKNFVGQGGESARMCRGGGCLEDVAASRRQREEVGKSGEQWMQACERNKDEEGCAREGG